MKKLAKLLSIGFLIYASLFALFLTLPFFFVENLMAYQKDLEFTFYEARRSSSPNFNAVKWAEGKKFTRVKPKYATESANFVIYRMMKVTTKWLPVCADWNINFEIDLYEKSPLASPKIYSVNGCNDPYF